MVDTLPLCPLGGTYIVNRYGFDLELPVLLGASGAAPSMFRILEFTRIPPRLRSRKDLGHSTS